MRRIATILITVLLCVSGSAMRANGAYGTGTDTTVICVLSDTQEPLFTERVMLGYDNNATVRARLLQTIAAMQPNAVIHLGDFTGLGFDPEGWKEAVDFHERLAGQQILYRTLPGNHEYIFNTTTSLAYYERATGSAKPYRSVIITGSTGVVLFNSNFGFMDEGEIAEQEAWFCNLMATLEADSSIRHILVATHHSPYTNSRVVAAAVLDSDSSFFSPYLAAFTSSKKSVLFLSGHAHAYELFRCNSRLFLVCGGGGGALQPLLRGTEQRYTDLLGNTDERRSFHFVSLHQQGNILSVYLHIAVNGQDEMQTLKIAEFN